MDEPNPAEQEAVGRALAPEYGLLVAALTATWGVSLGRTNILLAVLSATAVALGLVAQGSGFGDGLFLFALILLPVTLFLGLAAFARQVQIQRETYAYVIGINRIRHFLQTAAPASRPYFVLSAHDDLRGVYGGLGAGMMTGPPRFPLIYALIQQPGIVAVLDGAVAAAIAGVAAARFGGDFAVSLAVAAIVFVVVVAGLLAYWQRSMAHMIASLPPINPSPTDPVPGRDPAES